MHTLTTRIDKCIHQVKTEIKRAQLYQICASIREGVTRFQ